MSVDILMATYNGERYLRNQILSLQQQTYDDWTLWVRDDGSTDKTPHILAEFARSDKRIKIIDNNERINLGPAKGFLSLTKKVTAPYAIFCDQDDIWFERKLEFLVQYAEQHFDAEIPSLVYCDAYGYSDKEGVITLQSIYRYNAHCARTLNEFLFFNGGYQGCSILFNKKLCSLMSNYKPNIFFMHDDIASILAHSFGSVYFLPKPLMLYRQHEKNVTGNIKKGIINFAHRLLDLSRPVLSLKHYEEKKAFFEAYQNDLDEKSKYLFSEYLRFPYCNLAKRILLIIKNKFSYGGKILPLIVKTIIRKPLG